MRDPAIEFDMAFHRRAPSLTSTPESGSDEDFLTDLFCQCSPLADMMPPGLLRQQAEMQRASHRASHPLAMGRVIRNADYAIGRIMIDWTGEQDIYGVDIAVLPTWRRSQAGLAMLRAWLDVSDAVQRPCWLDVFVDNPARRIYQRLGFVALPGQADTFASISLRRPVPQRSSGYA